MTRLRAPHLRVRAATAHDLSAMATIVYEAMPSDPQWNYRFPLQKRFPEDNYGCTRQMLKSMLETDGVYINIVTFPSPCLHEDEEIPAAVSSPSNITATNPQHSIFYTRLTLNLRAEKPECRRDANIEHMNAFATALQSAKKSYSDSKYQSHHLHLRILATHPDFQRRGAASALCRWGVEYAGERKQPGTLFASPMGRKLYTYLGFKYLGTVPVQVEGEDEKLSIGAMMYSYPDEGDISPPVGPDDGVQQLRE
ncbi:hypothetical protein INS49_004832 [Diaporthe citri]|uniref:uncharacterized protein n=1 Tax=Diaporthe citri TaxID=83186 RepID=UPI001C82369A|nr:uncharacterized protein INS49_004832 [Diaporthe citri]KAG6354228.1 hypothetical protein INS49_004832 [Diaporthe citri]